MQLAVHENRPHVSVENLCERGPAGLGSRTWSSCAGVHGNLQIERRTLPYCRLDPDTAAMYLHDLFGNGEPKTSSTLGLRVRAVDLVELLENSRLMLLGDAGPGISYTDVEVPVHHLCRHLHLTHVGELDGVAYEVKEDLREALLITDTDG
jgi:hypothetical protein